MYFGLNPICCDIEIFRFCENMCTLDRLGQASNELWGLVWLRKRIITSFRPRNQLVHQYRGLKWLFLIVKPQPFSQNHENPCSEALDILRLLECTNINLGQLKQALHVCCICLNLLLRPQLTLRSNIDVFSCAYELIQAKTFMINSMNFMKFKKNTHFLIDI